MQKTDEQLWLVVAAFYAPALFWVSHASASANDARACLGSSSTSRPGLCSSPSFEPSAPLRVLLMHPAEQLVALRGKIGNPRMNAASLVCDAVKHWSTAERQNHPRVVSNRCQCCPVP